MIATLPIFTVGHSNRSLEELVELLREPHVERLIDIRKFPASRSNPQFNKDGLPAALQPIGIAYEHLASLGGRRGGTSDVARDTNGFWTNESFHNYADYALSDRFHVGLKQLLAESSKHRCAIMCSEAVWWRCHRRIVADYLIAAGREVIHIMAHNRLEPAQLTPGAIVRPDGSIIYPDAGDVPLGGVACDPH